jgi:hypothetical protein
MTTAGRCLVSIAFLVTVAGACSNRKVDTVDGCDNRLSEAYRRQECRACVARPQPHAYLPDNADGSRCVPR